MQADATVHQQQLQVEKEIRGLAEEILTIFIRGFPLMVFGRQDHFSRFLHDLLRDAIKTLCKELLRVAAIGRCSGLAALQQLLQGVQPRQRGGNVSFAIEAGVRATVASWAHRLGDDEQTILVTVGMDF